MKIRQGFVSNSSSSSFVIKREFLSDNQVKIIENHTEACQAYDPANENWGWNNDPGNAWTITVTPKEVAGFTGMNNFNMSHFLDQVGVDMDAIEWSY